MQHPLEMQPKHARKKEFLNTQSVGKQLLFLCIFLGILSASPAHSSWPLPLPAPYAGNSHCYWPLKLL